MAFSPRVFVLLCGISGLLTGAWAKPSKNRALCCPKGWDQFNDRCYIFQDEARTFTDAERICNLLGGNLASISDELENAVVYHLVEEADANQAWIGLHDNIEEEDFMWLDGTKFEFENFANGEPGGDMCVVIEADGGEWVGESCDSEEPYVCVADAFCYRH
ncbi:ladderlectin-like [Dunckerocampus dactyliophorus]|uniref:ladderlectin-like n=1 Tax=Dunckerocampus dactyliophorus TaxID=161453 RepID=UPI00240508A2|nr:ladderlectin-like [Dunckerocampus dactyliophorus]